MTISREIMELCTARGIRIRQSTDEMIVLDNVPLDARALSKPATNLCVIRDPQSQRFLAWVDADLRPKDPAHRIARLLTGQTKEQWQLVAPPEGFVTVEQALTETLRRLDTRAGFKPALPRGGSEQPLKGVLLPQVARRIRPDDPRTPLWNREHLIELASNLVRGSAGFVCLAGPSGSGLTACGVETLLQVSVSRSPKAGERETLGGVVQIDCGLVATEMLYPSSTDERFRQVLAECLLEPGTLYLLDNVNWILRASILAQPALATAIQRGLRGLCTFQCEGAQFPELLPMLGRRLHVIELPPLEHADLVEILTRQGGLLKAQHGLVIERDALSACMQLADTGVGAEPGRCLSLLDAAAALALANDAESLGPDDVAAARSTLCTQT